MLSKKQILLLMSGAILMVASIGLAGEYDGTVKIGGVIIDEQAGDLSAMQETYNLYEGFAFSQIKLNGRFDPKTYFRLNLSDINMDSRKGNLDFWMPGRLKLYGRYDQNRWVLDPNRIENSYRKDWRFGGWFVPVEGLKLTADYGIQTRDGEHVGYPMGTASNLGNAYDYMLQTGNFEAEFTKESRSVAVSYDFSSYSDDLNEVRDRFGYVFAARLRTPCYFTDKITHMVRGAAGKREITNIDSDYTLMNFQYVGVARPLREFQFKYNFYAGRIDDNATGLKTDNFRNNFDLMYFNRYGQVYGGYGYEINDDDKTLTSYNTFRVGGSFRGLEGVSGRVEYANRSKEDDEKTTLLMDTEMSTFLAKLQYDWKKNLVVGAIFKNREREFNDIDVEAEGKYVNAFGRYTYEGWGTVGAEYSYSDDDYKNLAGGFKTTSNSYLARVHSEWYRNARVGAALTYLDIGGDLDIEKSIVSFEAAYRFLEDFRGEVKYNIYNYDDYLIINKYYTANIVWINVAYEFEFGKK
ncbi:MAG: hypothetical protein P8181_10140 [bacterium]